MKNLKKIAFLLALLFVILKTTEGQTPKYFSGTVGTFTQTRPFSISNSRMQYLFLPSEIVSPSGLITKIYFRSNTSVPASTYSNFIVRLKDSSNLSSLPTSYLTTGFTTCVNAVSRSISAVGAGNWFSITLDTPFPHDSSKSLIVEISQTSTSGGPITRAFNTLTGNRGLSGNIGSSPSTTGASTNFGFDLQVTFNDAGVISIDSPSVSCLGKNQIFKATIKNFGQNQINGVFVNWSINGVTQFPAYHTTLLDTLNGTGPNTAQVTLGNFTPTVSPMTIKAWTSLPNSVVDTMRGNDSSTSVKNGALNGIYTIGGVGANYPSFTAAINALQNFGVCSHTTFLVRTGTYNEALVIPNIPTASLSNTITFVSEANHADSVVINDSIPIPLTIAASYCNFKFITFNQRSASANAININGNIQFDTLYNCKIITASSSTSNNYSIFANAISLNNVVIRRNQFLGSANGIHLYSTPNWSVNSIIDSNIFQNARNTPINYFFNTINLKFRYNTINLNGLGTNGAMNLQANDSAFEFFSNQITAIPGITFNINLSYYNVGNSVNRIKIHNNRISGGIINLNVNFFNNFIDLFNNVYNSGGSVDIGAFSSNIRFYHNTINSTTSFPIIIRGGGSNGLDIKNNVFSSLGNTYAAYWFSSPNTEICDYNNYFTNGPNLIYNNGTSIAYSNLSAWKNATSKDQSSLSYRPGFNSLNDLSPNLTDSAVWSLNGRGVHAPFVNNDINGLSRPITPSQGVPDIGAFEFTPNSIPPQAIAVPSTPTAGIQSFLFGQDTIAKITWPSSATLPSSVTARLYSGKNPPNNSIGDHMKSYWEFTFPTGNFNFGLSLFYKDPWIGTNPNELNLKMARYDNSLWTPSLGSLSVVDTIRNILTASSMVSSNIFTGTSTSNPLPVMLNYFKGFKENQDVKLNWSTATEVNCKHFEVQKSHDGLDFKTIKIINANGNSSSIISYSTIDYHAFTNEKIKTAFYRLKILDFDGKSEYSNILSISDEDLQLENILIYPNPSNSESLYIKIPNYINETIYITVSNVLGETIIEKTLQSSNNDLFELTEINKFNGGLYFIKVNIGSRSISLKFVKK